jgi:hypothetical protein
VTERVRAYHDALDDTLNIVCRRHKDFELGLGAINERGKPTARARPAVVEM